MSKFRAWLWSTVMLVSLCAFAGIVFADDAPLDPATNPTGALQQFWDAVTARKWGLAAVVGTMLFVAFARFIAPRIHGKFGAWINSSRVSAVLAIVSGGGAAVATQLMKGGPLTPKLLVYGFTIGLGAIGSYNGFFDIFFPDDKKTPPPSGATISPPTPPITKAAAFLPLAFLLFTTGCPAHVSPDVKTFGAAYGSCMTAKGLAIAPSVGLTVWADLNNGTDSAVIVAQLKTLAGKAGQDAVACAVQAWMTPTPGAPAAKNPAGVEAANIYLNRGATTERSGQHAALGPPQGCRPWTGALGAA